MGSHQTEWQLQQQRLHSLRKRAEGELQSALQSLALNSYDAQFPSTAVEVHALAKAMQEVMEESSRGEKQREDWAQLTRRPRQRAQGLIADVRRLRQKGAKETRLMAQRREDDLQTTTGLLRSLMHGLRHQSAEMSRELEQAERQLQEELKHCSGQWLERMVDDDLAPLQVEGTEEGMSPALPINHHWLATLSSDERREVEDERRRWSAVLVERLDMAERRLRHRVEHLQEEFRAAVSTLSVQRRVECNDDEERKEDNAESSSSSAEAEAVASAGATNVRRREVRGRLTVKGQRMAAARSWGAAEERRLRYLHREYSAVGKQRKELIERLELEFPTFALDQVKQRLQLHVHTTFHQQHTHLAHAQHKQTVADITQVPPPHTHAAHNVASKPVLTLTPLLLSSCLCHSVVMVSGGGRGVDDRGGRVEGGVEEEGGASATRRRDEGQSQPARGAAGCEGAT